MPRLDEVYLRVLTTQRLVADPVDSTVFQRSKRRFRWQQPTAKRGGTGMTASTAEGSSKSAELATMPLVLMYHSVSPYDEDPYEVTMTPSGSSSRCAGCAVGG